MRGLARLDGAGRLPGVDLARGLAVLGMVAAHVLTIPLFDVTDPGTWGDVVNGRSSILFATLAGVSIGLVTGGPVPLRGRPHRVAAGRLAVRAVLLWLLGVLLIGVYTPIYVILPAYGILFLLALPFLTFRARWVLPIAALLALVTPFLLEVLQRAARVILRRESEVWFLLGWEYPALVWIAFVLAGLGLARCDLRRTRTQVLALVCGTILAVVGYTAGAIAGAQGAAAVLSSRPHTSGLFEVIGSGGFAIAAIGLCCLASRGLFSRVVLPLRAVGSMPLTAYTAQIAAWWAITLAVVGEVSRFEDFYVVDVFWPLTIGIVVGCTLWALFVGRGPLEWLYDRIARTVVPAPRPAVAAAPREDRRDDRLVGGRLREGSDG